MKELFEAGYTITYGTVYGDTVLETLEDVEYYAESGAKLDEVDHEAKTAYFYAYEGDEYFEDDEP